MDFKKIIDRLQQLVYEGTITEDVAKKIYPDFVIENEDEMIRKDIIAFIKAVACKTAISEERESKWISYLEKQKKQKPILKFKIGNKIHLIDRTSPNYEDDCITIREIDTINYIGEFKEGYVPIKEQDKWELVKEQKPAEWSEGDERNLNLVIDCIYEFYPDPVMKYKLKDWLKSLRPNQEEI